MTMVERREQWVAEAYEWPPGPDRDYRLRAAETLREIMDKPVSKWEPKE